MWGWGGGEVHGAMQLYRCTGDGVRGRAYGPGAARALVVYFSYPPDLDCLELEDVEDVDVKDVKDVEDIEDIL